HARPMVQRNGVVQAWTVPALTPEAGNRLLDALTPDAQTVLDHSWLRQHGSDTHGYLDDTAADASARIAAACDESAFDADSEVMGAVDAGEMYGQAVSETIGSVGLVAGTTDDELVDMARELESDMLGENVVVLRAEQWLRDQRAELRTRREEEFDELGEQIEADTARWRAMIPEINGWRSQEHLAERIGKSQKTVSNIINGARTQDPPGRRNLGSTTDVWYVLGRVYALINDALSSDGGQQLDPHAVKFYETPSKGGWLRLYQQYASKGGGKWRDEITPLYAHCGHVWEQHERFPDQQSETMFQTGYHHQNAALWERPPYVPMLDEQ
ncbi:Plasmid maintenance system antidote protein VapI, contains XRE-type HTH domain, partial [Actinopolyspora alba]